ncbi:Glutamate--tRNA ligase [Tritonibacter multivorans]|uniref:Glutamate--tRNA ligase n=1 Tax=Tritonibacter multivorans TaxID=928856 RepID=A0A0P1H360_9RHOB|nr:tRNA glutamyl-Q(34) synthetase GluQRS [Tritonibacter multivorans]MDA7421575.1 tRNA glutamyl-Q(34) synthetase GluQRS [Tritonibacter multivorans]CUH82144.1 Glutamate--tRNA ligase [Tritonibacter multivorans]SFC95152.1 glutamyl-Q tRNA(Asp) synthetase [Tritonibacter multivorans]
MTFTTRFAPSPTGPLHLGHAYSALLAQSLAARAGGQFLLRIEDIDQSRARPEWEAQIYEDLAWLGLSWPTPVMRQSDRLSRYRSALAQLTEMGLTYPCRCNRADIEAAAGAPQEGVPQFGPDGRIYPGTCRGRKGEEPGANDVIRLNLEKALTQVGKVNFTEEGEGLAGRYEISAEQLLTEVGDIILVRRNMGSSYHLSVVVDDADQGITHVTRGADLFEATQVHVLLQKLLALPTPVYHHHPLIRDEAGKRLAKRDDARAIAKFRDDGASPKDIREMVGLT